MLTPTKRTAHSVYNLNYHIVLVVRYRYEARSLLPRRGALVTVLSADCALSEPVFSNTTYQGSFRGFRGYWAAGLR